LEAQLEEKRKEYAEEERATEQLTLELSAQNAQNSRDREEVQVLQRKVDALRARQSEYKSQAEAGRQQQAENIQKKFELNETVSTLGRATPPVTHSPAVRAQPAPTPAPAADPFGSSAFPSAPAAFPSSGFGTSFDFSNFSAAVPTSSPSPAKRSLNSSGHNNPDDIFGSTENDPFSTGHLTSSSIGDTGANSFGEAFQPTTTAHAKEDDPFSFNSDLGKAEDSFGFGASDSFGAPAVSSPFAQHSSPFATSASNSPFPSNSNFGEEFNFGGSAFAKTDANASPFSAFDDFTTTSGHFDSGKDSFG